MPDTALTLITDAMKLLRVLRHDEAPTAADASDGLRRLDAMLDSWNTERLSCFADVTLSRALVAGQASYTVGPGGDFAGVRPEYLIRAWVRDPNGQDIAQEVTTEARWDALREKAAAGSYPERIWYDPQYPLGVVYPWPVPTATWTQFLRYRAHLTAFGNLTTVVSLPPGYLEAITYNLAVRLAPYFGQRAVQAAGELIDPDSGRPLAGVLKERIKSTNANLVQRTLSSDAPLGGGGGRANILTNEGG